MYGKEVGYYALCHVCLFEMVVLNLPLCVCFFWGGGADLIAFAWGRTRVSEGGVPEDLFNPVYGGCYDRIVRLHRCFLHTVPWHSDGLNTCSNSFGWLPVLCTQSYTASRSRRTSRGESSSTSQVYSIHLLGWQQVECRNAG